MKKITKAQVLRMYNDMVNQFGGTKGVRDEGLLDAALSSPFQTYDGYELYPGIEEKAACLGYGLIENHAMIDGNKRLGVHVMLVFLALNGIMLNYTQEELYTVVLEVAAGKKNQSDLLLWIREHEKGE
ncbi:type II toxin-antitoxin system death-on-curing family toxin [uncultured Dialister sp.]|uniref:type II toxin-antitoxin system death-on-curing family toxin n=1 Tax=uncultured Dialister sp. TaxID=278064 RepID=UPI0026203E74|nr:type II toxin-antitoxin system death-on-curing family toxin [uncultured Dialister sp.]